MGLGANLASGAVAVMILDLDACMLYLSNNFDGLITSTF
jgi:hypothetical protein